MAVSAVDQITSFLRVHLGPETAAVFLYISKNSKSPLQMIMQQFRLPSEKVSFFPAENLAHSSSLRLLKYFEKSSPSLAFETMSTNNQVLQMVQQCLTLLLTHDLLILSRRKDSAIEYSINWAQVRVLNRAPAFLCLTRTQLGHAAELVIEELLYSGRLGLLACLATVAKRLAEEDEASSSAAAAPAAVDPGLRALNAFASLLELRFIQRRGSVVPPLPVADNSGCGSGGRLEDDDEFEDDDVIGSSKIYRVEKPFAPLSRAEREAALRHIRESLGPAVKLSNESLEPPAKRPRVAAETTSVADARRPEEAAQEFSANAQQLRFRWRDSILTRAAASVLGAQASRVLAAMLDIVDERVRLGHAQSAESEVLAHADIVAQLAASAAGDARSGLDQHLSSLAEDGFIERQSGAAGGQFRILFRRAIFSLTRQSVAAVIRQRLGDKAVRVFNALSEEPNLTQAELESHVLIGGRDCKELLYRLLVDGFVHCAELSRAADFMNPRPNTAYYLFHVNLEQTTRKLLLNMHAYQDRLLTRRLAEVATNRRLLDKRQRVKELLKNLDAQISAADSAGNSDASAELSEQRAQAAQLLTPPEREQLETLKRSRTALRAGELLLEENIFLYELFLEFASQHN
ncbi:hypothetical protein BOX15_Mlig006743g1 [Macrostomum lignano]|uniref:Uncharacterized protein n=2 Tax=Macrostomum lignano TaxID=282301 RepID=A0A267EM36_9PLAT|nr:hypothetical protein BOX15_Mlig006743g1 [Macrostomum lignano]